MNSKGSTLAEVLIVTTIIAFLAGGVLMSINKSTKKAKEEKDTYQQNSQRCEIEIVRCRNECCYEEDSKIEKCLMRCDIKNESCEIGR